MPRVTNSEVLEIFDTTTDTTPFIVAANLMVTELLLSAGYSDARLKEIERWLAAHFACVLDPREKEVHVGQARAIFEGETGKGLDATRYGQQVKILDTSAILERSTKLPARISVVSTPPESSWYTQVAWLDRNLRQTATYWAPASKSAWGTETFATPVQIFCHWEARNESFESAAGGIKQSRAVVSLASAVAIDGFLLLGESEAAAPGAVDGADRIQRVDANSSLRADVTVYTAYL